MRWLSAPVLLLYTWLVLVCLILATTLLFLLSLMSRLPTPSKRWALARCSWMLDEMGILIQSWYGRPSRLRRKE